MNFMTENWLAVTLSVGLVGSTGVIACGCFLVGLALWKPQAAHRVLIQVRSLFNAAPVGAAEAPSGSTLEGLDSSDL